MSTPTQSTNPELRLTPQNPWPGLAAFTAANREFFYGRETEIAEIFRRVERQLLTVLFGVSGLGKTSLLQAGLLPKLGGTPFHPILIRLDHSPAGEDLIEQMRAAIQREVEIARQLGVQVPRGPEPGEDLWGYFHDRTTDWLNAKGEVVNPVLVFDQFEEIFTREADTRELQDRRQSFIELLASLVENRPPDDLVRRLDTEGDLAERFDFRQDDYRVVISLREDFLAHLESFKQRMPSLMENRMRLKPMTEEQALQAVLGPGREIVDEPVAREIVAFVAGKARGTQPTTAATSASVETAAVAEADPVLLSLVCDQLNRRRLVRKQERITADLLTAEREGIIQEFYEQAFKGLDAKVREWVEDNLLTASGYRNRAAQEDALHAGVPPGAVDELVNGRILHREERGKVLWLELTHDLLTGPAVSSRQARKQRLAEAAAALREAALKAERDAQRRKARRSAWLSRSLAAALVGLLALAWWYWDRHMREHTAHFHTFTRRWGLAEGVGQLAAEEMRHRPVSFRFVYQPRGTVIRVEAVDAAGRLTRKHDVGTMLKYASDDQNPERECQWEFVRNAEGKVVYELAKDRNGRLVWGFAYSPPGNDKATRRAHYVDASGMPLPMRNSAVEYIEFTYDRNGFEQKVVYQDNLGHPQSGADGQYGEVREFDARGLVTRRTSLAEDGRTPMVDQAGNSTLEYEYDARGRQVRAWASALDKDWKPTPVMLKRGFHEIRLRYNDYGVQTEEAYFDLATNAVATRDGSARWVKSPDAQGNYIEYTYFDAKGQPTLGVNGVFRYVFEFDARGNQTAWRSYGTNNRPAANLQGIARVVSEYDQNDFESARSFFDTAGKPFPLSDGTARITYRRDARGRVLEERFFDETGAPRLSEKRHAGRRFEYDERGNALRVELFDGAGKLMRGTDGYASFRAKYDERGNRIEESYFDEHDRPVPYERAYARKTWRYDARGNAIEEAYFDEQGRPARLAKGYVREQRKFDALNRLTEVAYFNEQNQLVARTDGYARQTMAYDARGNVVEEAYFDVTGGAEPGSSEARAAGRGEAGVAGVGRGRSGLAELAQGYARIETRFNEQDLWVEKKFFQANGMVRSNTAGPAVIRANYNALRQQIEESHWNADGKPFLTNGYVRLTMAYDERGNQTNEFYFDKDGPTLHAKTHVHGWWKQFDERGYWTNKVNLNRKAMPAPDQWGDIAEVRAYNARGNLTEACWLDEQGKLLPQRGELYARVRCVHDAWNNRTEEAYFDSTDNPVTINDGYARWTKRYDERGLLREQNYWGTNGPAADVAREEYRYDAGGNLLEKLAFDARGDPANQRGTRWHKWEAAYDADGQRTNLAYRDINGALVNGANGYARQVSRFENGRLVERKWLDAAGDLAKGEESHALMKARYDAHGNLVEQSFFGANGQPVDGPEGHAHYAARFAGLGRRLSAKYTYSNTYSTNSPGSRQNRNHASESVLFDERGNQIQWACFDEQGRPMLNLAEGVHKVEKLHDEYGRWISKAYFGTNGQLMMTTNGYARIEVTYDEGGRFGELWFYDENDEPVHTGEYSARKVRRHDSEGRKREEWLYYAANGEFARTNGYAQVRQEYDERENLVRWSCYDSNGAPAVDLSSGEHSFVRHFNARGFYTNQLNFDTHGNLVVTSNGYARIEVVYDLRDRVRDIFYFDERNQPMHAGESAWRQTRVVSAGGRILEKTLHYATNSPLFLANGIAARHEWLDGANNVTNQIYFDAEGRRTRSSDGYAEARATYDAEGRQLTSAFYGPIGEPVLEISSGAHVKELIYDERGQITQLILFGTNREPVLGVDGYHRVVVHYDQDGGMTAREFFDPMGRALVWRPAVESFLPGSQAEKAGVHPGDLLLSYNGQELTSINRVGELVNAPGPETRELKVRRGNETLIFQLKSGVLGTMLRNKLVRLPENETANPP